MKRNTADGVVWYEGECFSSGIVHGFSTKLGGVSTGAQASLNLISAYGGDVSAVRENYRRFHQAVGFSGHLLERGSQVHGDTLRLVTSGREMDSFLLGEHEAGDGLMTQEKGLALWVYSADCTPILYYDPRQEAIAAVHAGWRGTALGISEKTIWEMKKAFGSKPEDIQVSLGPGIGACCFLCHEDVPQAMKHAFGTEIEVFLQPSTEEGKVAVDLQGIHRFLLARAGVTQIDYGTTLCTACGKEEFWSHRVLGKERGSMGGMIALGEVTA